MKSFCEKCHRECDFNVEYEPWISGYVATCGNCYDGAPDGGYRVGTGAAKTTAIADYNEQFEE